MRSEGNGAAGRRLRPRIGLNKNSGGSTSLSRRAKPASAVARFARPMSTCNLGSRSGAARRSRARPRSPASCAADAILSSREYGFCLYPEKNLRDFLLAFPADESITC